MLYGCLGSGNDDLGELCLKAPQKSRAHIGFLK